MSSVVIYKSQYGSTKHYANWIAESLSCEIYDLNEMKQVDFTKFDTIIFGGRVMAGSIQGLKAMLKEYEKLKNKELIVFSVSLTGPEDKKWMDDMIHKNLSDELLKTVKVFNFQGSIDLQKLKLSHKVIMKGIISGIRKKKSEERSELESKLLEAEDKELNLEDRNSINPLLEYIRR